MGSNEKLENLEELKQELEERDRKDTGQELLVRTERRTEELKGGLTKEMGI